VSLDPDYEPDWQGLNCTAERHERLHEELVSALGQPSLVTDPADGITRPTWTVEVPYDRLAAICEQSNRRMVDDSEDDEAD
jgi:hypothetical protein